MSHLNPHTSTTTNDPSIPSPMPSLSPAQDNTLRAILYEPSTPTQFASLRILNQRLLPHETVYIPIRTGRDAFTAIRDMSVRGAPAIAIVAALSLAVECQSESFVDVRMTPGLGGSVGTPSAVDVAARFEEALDMLLYSRPTAVNLGDAVRKLVAVVAGAARVDGATGLGVQRAFVSAAERMLVDDVADNTAIGRYGARWIMERCGKGVGVVSVLTHCNTGSLATAGYGTALGIVRSLHAAKVLERAYYTETRPYNQGSRLTGYELLHDGIPCTLITDSMAAALMEKFRTGEGDLAAVIVGADRVAANGDTANKIGTYALAVLARFHGVKFLVAAPRTTIDLATPSGKEIVIEERPTNEMFTVRGPEVLGYDPDTDLQTVDVRKISDVSTAALGTHGWNPAFDVTPAALIDGIVTEVGVAEKDEYGRFDLQYLFSLNEVLQDIAAGEKEMPDPREGP